MKNLFKPDEIINRFNLFDADKYLKLGYTTILMDIDNTLDIPDSKKPASKEAYDFLLMLKDKGYHIILFSNNTKERVLAFLDGRDYDYNYFSKKPLPFAYHKIMKKYTIKPSEMISFGDQMLTDLVGANFCGIYTIYCKQLIEKDSITTKINRMIERWIFKHVLHQEM